MLKTLNGDFPFVILCASFFTVITSSIESTFTFLGIFFPFCVYIACKVATSSVVLIIWCFVFGDNGVIKNLEPSNGLNNVESIPRLSANLCAFVPPIEYPVILSIF